MTSNFNRVESETNTRIDIGDIHRYGSGDWLTDRIDSRWSPMVASDMDNEALMIPPSTNSSIPALQEQLAMLRKERERLSVSYERAAQDFLSSSIPPISPGNSLSPTSVMDIKRLKDPVDAKKQEPVALSKQNCNYVERWPPTKGYQNPHNQFQPFGNQHNLNQVQKQYQLQQQQLHNQQQYRQQYNHQQKQMHHHHQQRAAEFGCLHPRDDRRSRVRFSQSLSVYDNFEDFDYSDISSPEITNRKTLNKEEKDPKLSFMLHRARHCWYSKDELKRIKGERKVIVRQLRIVKFDVRSIDPSVHELRGLEAYLSPEILKTTLRKRKDTLEAVFNEQNRQRSSPGGQRNAEAIQLASLRVSEWFRTRAYEFAEKDAKEARDLYMSHPEVMNLVQLSKSRAGATSKTLHQGAATQELSMACEQMNDSIGLMDIDDENVGNVCLNNSTLSFWANSSWAKDLMEE